jgi:ribonuclease HI
MSFKGQTVWVHVDESGRPLLDSTGKAEMKYRESDTRIYKPLPQNLGPANGAPHQGFAAGRKEAPASPSSKAAFGARASKAPTAVKAVSKLAAARSSSADTIHVWTDGACSGNPGPMGIGVVVIAGNKRKEHGEFLGRGTNNIAELTAIRRGLEIAREIVPEGGRPIAVYSDSSYAIGLLSQGWRAKANQELVAEIREFLRDYSGLRWVKVDGHAGVAENERCDVLARQAVATNRHL